MDSPGYDVAVIGGGIIGLATAMSLTAHRPLSLIVLEAEDKLAAHQTGHNSGVIHSGLYYRPDSSKAETCVRGRRELVRFCEEQDIPHETCGKLVIATAAEETQRLDELEKRGRANGLEGLKRLRREEIQEHEPHATGVDALWVPETGIVDFLAVANAYARLLGYVKDKGWEAQLPYREIYLKGPGMIFRGNPKNYLTEIQFLVEENTDGR